MSAMSLSDEPRGYASAATAAQSSAKTVARQRDIRLDFFRGIAMFIILIAHTPSNWWALWIPARFGFSDATEMFVFCSGMTSAIAFGSVYRNQGWVSGTSRVLFRIWQVYWAHIALFVAIAATTAAMVNSGLFEVDYVGQLNLYLFYKNPLEHLPGLLTLTYVPNYFDILPMYIVVLAMMPIVVAFQRAHLWLAVGFVVSVWLFANIWQINLPAEPLSQRKWFFNPFGWQLIFFTGFAFASGWIKPPAFDRRILLLAVFFVIASVPFSYFRIINLVPEISVWRRENAVFIDKTSFGLFRYLHFLALAYIAVCLVGPKGTLLSSSPNGELLARIWATTRGIIVMVGQQSLAVFVFSMFIAVQLGALLDIVGRNYANMIWVNLLGFAMIVCAAFVAQWFKKKPWLQKGTMA